MDRRRVCVVTGSRAEYGLLFWLLTDLQADPQFDLQLVVTGMHLAPEFGNTVREIENDGFSVARRVEMLLSGGTPIAIAKSVGLGVIGLSDALAQLEPDVVVLLGDRFEIFAAAQAAMIHNIPIAHLHFATNAQSAARIRQLGENPDRVFDVGSPGLDHLRRRPLLDRAELEQALGEQLGTRNLLVTFHPVTLLEDCGLSEFDELLAALERLDPSTKLWFTSPNADAGGRAMASKLQAWVAGHRDRARSFASLGSLRYLSLMAKVDAVVGNSSSGLYEAPSLGVPTVDIGDRQLGRLAASSVISCVAQRDDIRHAIDRAMALDCKGTVSPYGDGRATARIVEVLRSMPERAELLRKSFHMMGSGRG
jgi:UDP-N-acetylglucosamine 2-epimerase (non-hydrolysing)/GDP/UDP-N,N'-diacetylbacillosamine 2-epimerase (hydrolysing)